MSSTQFDGDIDSFVSYLKSNRGLSANTLKAYRADLTACLHLFELRGVTDLERDHAGWICVAGGGGIARSRPQQHGPQNRGRARVLRVGL